MEPVRINPPGIAGAEPVKTASSQILVIRPDGTISQTVMTFDLDIRQSFTNPDTKKNFEMIAKNMRRKNNCQYHTRNVAKATYPMETFYHAFYESVNDEDKKFNKVATHIINHPYNTDESTKPSVKCYGNCYILHFDGFYDFHDVGVTAFVNAYNKVYTTTGMQDRCAKTRLSNKKASQKYCVCKKDGGCTII